MIICGFPGVGKTHAFNSGRYSICDSDSSKFPKDGFPENYIAHIKEMSQCHEFVLVSSHREVRDALTDHEMEFVYVYPRRGALDEYRLRYTQRGSSKNFMSLLEAMWHVWIEEAEAYQSQYCIKVPIGENIYLLDILEFIGRSKVSAIGELPGIGSELLGYACSLTPEALSFIKFAYDDYDRILECEREHLREVEERYDRMRSDLDGKVQLWWLSLKEEAYGRDDDVELSFNSETNIVEVRYKE